MRIAPSKEPRPRRVPALLLVAAILSIGRSASIARAGPSDGADVWEIVPGFRVIFDLPGGPPLPFLDMPPAVQLEIAPISRVCVSGTVAIVEVERGSLGASAVAGNCWVIDSNKGISDRMSLDQARAEFSRRTGVPAPELHSVFDHSWKHTARTAIVRMFFLFLKAAVVCIAVVGIIAFFIVRARLRRASTKSEA